MHPVEWLYTLLKKAAALFIIVYWDFKQLTKELVSIKVSNKNCDIIIIIIMSNSVFCSEVPLHTMYTL